MNLLFFGCIGNSYLVNIIIDIESRVENSSSKYFIRAKVVISLVSNQIPSPTMSKLVRHHPSHASIPQSPSASRISSWDFPFHHTEGSAATLRNQISPIHIPQAESTNPYHILRTRKLSFFSLFMFLHRLSYFKEHKVVVPCF